MPKFDFLSAGAKGLAPSLWSTALILALMAICIRSTNNMVVTTMPLLEKYVFGSGDVSGGLIVGAFYVTNIFAAFYVNPRLNRTLRRRAFILCYGGITLSLYLFSISTETTVWLLALFAGFATGIVFPNLSTSASLGTDRVSSERLISLYALSLSLSLILGPALESYALTVSFRFVFITFLLVSLAGFPLTWKLRFPDVAVETRKSSARSSTGLKSAITVFTIYSIPFSAFTVFLAIYATEHFNVSSAVAYSVFLPFYIVSFITRMYITVKPLGSLRLPTLFSIAVTIVGLAAMNVAPSFVYFYIIIGFLGIAHGSMYTISLILLARSSTTSERSTVYSYFSTYTNILFVSVPVAIGFLSQFIGIYLTFIFLLLPVAFTSGIFFRSYWKIDLLN